MGNPEQVLKQSTGATDVISMMGSDLELSGNTGVVNSIGGSEDGTEVAAVVDGLTVVE